LSGKTEARIYRLSGVCAFLATTSLIVPRFISNPEGGFASGASAVLVLLVMLAATLLFSFYLMSISIQKYHTISVSARIAGIGPGVVLTVALIGFFTCLRY